LEKYIPNILDYLIDIINSLCAFLHFYKSRVEMQRKLTEFCDKI